MFNDKNVEPCKYENMEEEAFGGKGLSKNAYLLLYQRKNIEKENSKDLVVEEEKEFINNSQLKLFFSN